MGLPQYFTIVVISYEDESLSSTVAALLGGPGMKGVSPQIEPSCFSGARTKPQALVDAGKNRGLQIVDCIPSRIIGYKGIDLWLALDDEAEKWLRMFMKEEEPLPNRSYRYAFPDPIVNCGFHVPKYWENSKTYEAWFDELENLFMPWKTRIWKEFYNSS